MKKAAIYCSMVIFLLAWTGLSFGVEIQEGPPRTLIVQTIDSNPLTLTIVNSGGDPTIPDVTVDSVTYLDINTITGRMDLTYTDTIEMAIDVATTWELTGSHSGTVAIEGYSTMYFSAIDSLVGAAGEDTFIFQAGVGFGGTLDGGEGINTLDYSAFTASIMVSLSAGTAPGTAGISNIQGVIGGTGNDIITGDSNNNTFTGGLGKDTLTGGDGFDTIVETRDADFALTDKELTINGEADQLSGIEAAFLTGGPEGNVLNAWSFHGPVVLDGAGGDDTLWGGAGDDVLIGGAGINDIHGGSGDDTVLETCDADFYLENPGLLSWNESADTLDQIENVHLIGGSGDNQFDISVSALAGASVLVEGGAGYDTLALESSDSDVQLTSGEITIGSGPQSVNYETVEEIYIDGTRVYQPPTADPGGPYLTAVNAEFTVDGSASFDPDGDELTYNWTFDGTTQTGATPSFVAPAEPGIYQLDLTVDDSLDGTDTASTSVVVYDPAAGFVTGGGWFESPAGAYADDPSLTGEATFGFVSKYQKGATIPTGNTEFEFQAGGLYFHSTGYDWLVVTGSDYARFKGSGTINGAGDYKFMVWAGDGEPDTFRIRIWEEDEETGDETDIYDNGFDQEIGGGSIVIHTKKK